MRGYEHSACVPHIYDNSRCVSMYLSVFVCVWASLRLDEKTLYGGNWWCFLSEPIFYRPHVTHNTSSIDIPTSRSTMSLSNFRSTATITSHSHKMTKYFSLAMSRNIIFCLLDFVKMVRNSRRFNLHFCSLYFSIDFLSTGTVAVHFGTLQ